MEEKAKEVLEYHAPEEPPSESQFHGIVHTVAASVLVTIFAFVFLTVIAPAMLSKSNFEIAVVVLYPGPALMLLVLGGSATFVSFGAAIVQFSAYGFVIAFCRRKRRLLVAMGVIALHLVAIAACYFKMPPSPPQPVYKEIQRKPVAPNLWFNRLTPLPAANRFCRPSGVCGRRGW